MKKQAIESQVETLYVDTLVKMIGKPNAKEFIRSQKLLASLDDYMNSGGLQMMITTSSQKLRKKN